MTPPCNEADQAGVTTAGRSIGRTIHGGKGGNAPARELPRSAGLLGFEGAESLANPVFMGDNGLPDHIAGMKQLAERHPWIDIDRAGTSKPHWPR